MQLTYFDAKDNTLYIKSKIMLPDTKGLPFKTHLKMYSEALKKSYSERLLDYATAEQMESVLKEIDNHPGCSISEFSDL